jgi:hypothetical protein
MIKASLNNIRIKQSKEAEWGVKNQGEKKLEENARAAVEV